jgi:hypothetical protein
VRAELSSCDVELIRVLVTAMPDWPQYGVEANTMVFNGYGSIIQPDDDRSDGIQYIIDNVLTDGAL